MKYGNTPLVVASLVGLIAAVGSCEREGDEVIAEPQATDIEALDEDTAADSRGDQAPRGAVEIITNARCAREARCENVGAGRDYASAEACEADIREDWADELNAFECPGGVVEKELDECVEEITNEDCNSPFDTLGRIAACRSSDICLATEAADDE
jgi:hypothetical protein